jgi:hypothetical protein
MGTLSSVRCPVCGVIAEELLGIGGDYGMSGAVVVTVVCTKVSRLVDVGVPSLSVARGDKVPGVDRKWPPTEPCPTKRCKATDHRPWRPRQAVCPGCGARGCAVEFVGCWD